LSAVGIDRVYSVEVRMQPSYIHTSIHIMQYVITCMMPFFTSVVARMDKAIELYNLSKTKASSCGFGPCMVTLSAGTPHVPPPHDSKGFPLYESTVGAKYLIKAGIPTQNIFEEKLSLDTLGNVRIVYF
jgi:uncharacterized SAM-binding protein YcdF (DUF218 family)